MIPEKKCGWWSGHHWSKWKDIKSYVGVREPEHAIIQKRRCSECDKVQLRREST